LPVPATREIPGRRGNQGVVELEPHLIVIPWQQIDVEVNQRIENGKLQALGRVHDRNAARVPASAILPGSEPGESLVEKRLAQKNPAGVAGLEWPSHF
jgi:hypothetical protein